MSQLVVIGFPDESAARLAYDEVLNLSDSHDLVLEGLAIRTAGPTGRIRVEVPDQMTAGSLAGGPRFTEFVARILETRDTGDALDAEPGGISTETAKAMRTSPAVVVIMASHVAWKRFRLAMSVFDGITVAMPAGA
jgi:uncharacterized membrane protein